MNHLYLQQLEEEFDRQIDNLVQKGYPKITQRETAEFLELITPLKANLAHITPPPKTRPTKQIPFVIVIKEELITAEEALPLIEIKGKAGFVDMNPLDSHSFTTIDSLSIPAGQAYLLVDIETGQETLNVTPHEALQTIQKQNREPLIIAEGVALITHFPEVLTDKANYNCFSILGSRRDDQRVPAMWISYKKPRLGWCWDKNPHTWLGSASCGRRIGVSNQ